MVGLPREIGRDLVVDPVDLERAVAGVTPQHRVHPEVVGFLERLRHLLKLTGAVVGTEVDRCADTRGTEIEGLPGGAEHHLVGLVGIGQQFVGIDLDDERDAVRVPAADRAEHAERGCHCIAPAFDRQLDDVGRIEVERVGSERRCRGVLDALVDRQDRQVAGVGQPTVAVQLPEAAQHGRRPVRAHERAIEEVGARQHELVAGDPRTNMGQQRLGFVAEQGGHVHDTPRNWFTTREGRHHYVAVRRR